MDPKAIEKDSFGKTADGVCVDRYTLRNSRGMTVRLINFGATVTELHVPDRRGQFADVVLGFDKLADYESRQNPYFGATVGRVAFRITEGKFTLDSRPHQLSLNVPPHHLHGGTRGLSRVVWETKPVEDGAAPGLQFDYVSPNGDQGYPGRLAVSVVYRLTECNELAIRYTARTDRATPVNLTHHGYFNLSGAGRGDVLRHVLKLHASRYTPLDDKKIPTGKIVSVEGSPYDFQTPTPIGARMKPGSEVADGYDLSYPVDRGNEPGIAPVATLSDPASGRKMEVFSDQPAIVLYTGNYLDGALRGKGDVVYPKHAGVCLETAHLPDSVNRPEFPSIILRPGETYRQQCVYRFSAEEG